MKAYLADWILPVATPPIHNGALVVDEEGRIVFVGEREKMPSGTEQTAYPSSVIMPGLINAHTHLEFSDLEAPLGQPGIEFTQWIGEVIKFRFGGGRVTKPEAIQMGLKQSAKHGVVAIGEIATSPLAVEDYLGALPCPMFLRVFFEQLGSDDSVIDQKITELEEFFGQAAAAESKSQIVAAISPHAPYSVGDRLLEELVTVSQSKRSCIAMHVAETMAEREFVEVKTGPFVDMLRSLGVWRPEAYGSYGSITRILEKLSQCESSLVVHGNYLNGEELDFIASNRDKMSVVFCPRTHAFFGHARYPLEELLGRGINVAVGTDSRASNPDLDLGGELVEIHRRHPDLAPETVLKMGTIAGAAALGLDESFGTLVEGRKSHFCVRQGTDTSSPYAWLAVASR
jgi:cytosine/adenosine deaminase-related metal-dependent hydrolase